MFLFAIMQSFLRFIAHGCKMESSYYTLTNMCSNKSCTHKYSMELCVCVWLESFLSLRICNAILWSFHGTTFSIRWAAIKVIRVAIVLQKVYDSLMLFRFTPHNLLMKIKLKFSVASASDASFQWIIIMSFAMLHS